MGSGRNETRTGTGDGLRVLREARAKIIIQGVGLFQNVQVFETPGSHQFTVPDVKGDGSPVEVEVACYGGGGGGGGAYMSAYLSGQCRSGGGVNPHRGGAGGPGGKATSFLTLPVGTILTVQVGGSGNAGEVGQSALFRANCGGSSPAIAGTAGAFSEVRDPSNEIISHAEGGGGGQLPGDGGGSVTNGSSGAAGSGTGAIVEVGGAANGGAAAIKNDGFSATAATAGGAGRVEIRY